MFEKLFAVSLTLHGKKIDSIKTEEGKFQLTFQSNARLRCTLGRSLLETKLHFIIAIVKMFAVLLP